MIRWNFNLINGIEYKENFTELGSEMCYCSQCETDFFTVEVLVKNTYNC